ncbi:MAG: glutamate racemase [Granulosicoccus sp.]|jgi:glutamate racemase
MRKVSFFCTMDNRPIGIFDSGIGGLTLATAILQALPSERLIYFGDTAHLPYGDKSEESIKEYSLRIADFLKNKDCKAILIACNTASSIAFESISNEYDFPVYNVIDPVTESVAKSFTGKKVGVIGTKGTIATKIYQRRLLAGDPSMIVVEKATTLLASMIEEGFHNDSISKAVIQAYLEDTQFVNLDALIPACTHYPLISNQIHSFFEGTVNVIDAPRIVAEFIKSDLKQRNLLATQSKSTHKFFVSDRTEAFEKATRIFFGEELHLEEHRFLVQ